MEVDGKHVCLKVLHRNVHQIVDKFPKAWNGWVITAAACLCPTCAQSVLGNDFLSIIFCIPGK